MTKMIKFPQDWQTKRIGEVFSIKQGKALSSRKQTGINRRSFLRTSNVFWGCLKLDILDEMSFTDDECSALALEYNDLLVCEGGDIGRTAIWGEEIADCYYQNHLHRLRRVTNDVFPLFVMYWMQAAMTQLNVYEGISNKTTIPNLSRSRLAEFLIPLPPIAEQKKIAAVLLKVQRAIEVQDKIIQSLNDLKKSTMQHLFTHGLHGEKTKMTELGEIPESWEVVRFIDFAVLQRGFDITKREQRHGKIPVVSSGGISSYHDRAQCSGPGVIIGRKGSLGTVHYIESDYWPHDTTLWIKDFKGNSSRYVFWFLQTLRLERFDSGSSNPTLNRNTVHKELVVVPKLQEQEAIAANLYTISAKATFHSLKKVALQDLFKTALNMLMTGTIRVADLDCDVQEVER